VLRQTNANEVREGKNTRFLLIHLIEVSMMSDDIRKFDWNDVISNQNNNTNMNNINNLSSLSNGIPISKAIQSINARLGFLESIPANIFPNNINYVNIHYNKALTKLLHMQKKNKHKKITDLNQITSLSDGAAIKRDMSMILEGKREFNSKPTYLSLHIANYYSNEENKNILWEFEEMFPALDED